MENFSADPLSRKRRKDDYESLPTKKNQKSSQVSSTLINKDHEEEEDEDYQKVKMKKKKAKKNKKSSDGDQNLPKNRVSLKGDVPPLAKFLASNDKSTRDRAVIALNKFLSTSNSASVDGLTEEHLFSKAEDQNEEESEQKQDEEEEEENRFKELYEEVNDQKYDAQRLDKVEQTKLYKGLFYCYWMSDKPIVQQDLSLELSKLCLNIRPSKIPKKFSGPPSKDEGRDRAEDFRKLRLFVTRSGLEFWKGFWENLNKEWFGIDKHRIDKYLLLIRRFVWVGFELLRRVDWDRVSISYWSQILKETVFNVTDHRTTLSITYHFIDIFLEEFDRVLSSCINSKFSSDLKRRRRRREGLIKALNLLLEPVLYGLSKSQPGTATFKKVLEEILDPIIDGFISRSIDFKTRNDDKEKNDDEGEGEEYRFKSFKELSEVLSLDDLKGLKADVLRTIFKVGSDVGCLNRKKIYKYLFSKGWEELLDD